YKILSKQKSIISQPGRQAANSSASLNKSPALSTIVNTRIPPTASSLSHSTVVDRNRNSGHVIVARQITNSSTIDEATVDISKLSVQELKKALESAEHFAAVKKNATDLAERELKRSHGEAANSSRIYEEKKKKWEDLDGIATKKEEDSANSKQELQSAIGEFGVSNAAFTEAEQKMEPHREKLDAYLANHLTLSIVTEDSAVADADKVVAAADELLATYAAVEAEFAGKEQTMQTAQRALNAVEQLLKGKVQRCARLAKELAAARGHGAAADAAEVGRLEPLLLAAERERDSMNASLPALRDKFDAANAPYLQALSGRADFLILGYVRAAAERESKRAALSAAEEPEREAIGARAIAAVAKDEIASANLTRITAERSVAQAERGLDQARKQSTEANARVESLKQAFAKARTGTGEASSAGTTTIALCAVGGLVVLITIVIVVVLWRKGKLKLPGGKKPKKTPNGGKLVSGKSTGKSGSGDMKTATAASTASGSKSSAKSDVVAP
ncbi:hypothetical protein PFISCL1PPCAC_17971, partial [Pristionchus fissidentatus]